MPNVLWELQGQQRAVFGEQKDPHDPAKTTHVFKGFDADEGGEVRVEYIKVPSGAFGSRVTAFLYKDSGTTKFFPYLSLNGCTNMTGTNHGGKWPMAQNPVGERVSVIVGVQLPVGVAVAVQVSVKVGVNVTE